MLAKFDDCFLLTLRIGPYLFHIEKFNIHFKTTEKMIGLLLVFEKMAIYFHGEVQAQRKSRHFLMRAS